MKRVYFQLALAAAWAILGLLEFVPALLAGVVVAVWLIVAAINYNEHRVDAR